MEKDKIIGEVELINSKIELGNGSNIVYCDNSFGKVILENSKIAFMGENSLIYICGSKNEQRQRFRLNIYSNSTLYIGTRNNFNKSHDFKIFMGEETNVFIGDDNLFSEQITVRPDDGHLIYSAETHKRINYSKDIFIGDHVWLSQEVMLLKGVKIGSGAIVGSNSLISNKTLASNCIYAGSPVKLLNEDVFFVRKGTHELTKETSAKYDLFPDDDYIFKYNEEECVVSDILEFLRNNKDMSDRIEYLKNLPKNKSRFALPKT